MNKVKHPISRAERLRINELKKEKAARSANAKRIRVEQLKDKETTDELRRAHDRDADQL